MFDRRLLQYFDWGLLGLTCIIGSIGLLTLYSAVTAETPEPQKIIFYKQLIWFSAALVAMTVSFSINYKLLDRWGQVLYIGCVLLLLWVLFFGKYVGGSRRWLILGPMSIQPSELAKIAVMIVLARYYSKDANTRGHTLRELFRPAVLTLIPFVLIVRQPDLGTAGLVLLIAGSITLFVKIERRSLIYLIVSCAAVFPLVWFFLKEYQKRRILVFLDPDLDPLGAGYHIIQSKIAIGSGMISGKGFLSGTQNALSFLPEEHTDFIFSVIGEELGLLGVVIIIGLYAWIVIRGIAIARNAPDLFGGYLAVGLTIAMGLQIVVNMGVALGLLPTKGLTLPLLSYGGTSLLLNMASIGILMNIGAAKKH